MLSQQLEAACLARTERSGPFLLQSSGGWQLRISQLGSGRHSYKRQGRDVDKFQMCSTAVVVEAGSVSPTKQWRTSLLGSWFLTSCVFGQNSWICWQINSVMTDKNVPGNHDTLGLSPARWLETNFPRVQTGYREWVKWQGLWIHAPGATTIDGMQWNKHSPLLLVAMKSL